MAKFKQSFEQKQKLSPQQILQTNILQLNVALLEQKILDELEENPALELAELEDDPTKVSENEDQQEEENSDDTANNEPEFEWEELVSDPDGFGIPSRFERSEGKEFAPLRAQKSTSEKLMEQFIDLGASEKEIEIAEELIGNIDDDGYLTVDTILVSDRLQSDASFVESVLLKIQSLHPSGMGARNLQECLLAQIDGKKYPLSEKILSEYFDDIANHRYQQIMDNLNCTREELHDTLDVIAQLNPKPGSSISESDKDYVIPDILMDEEDGEWQINMNDTSLPTLRISDRYLQMMKDYGDKPDVKKFIKEKLESAKLFIDAVSQRQKTIIKVMSSIIDKQPFFFGKLENRYLKPMILKDVAEDIEMDISTISRVTNGKYVQLPFGIYELKGFFSEGIKTEDNKQVSNTIVKNRLKEIILSEDKTNPIGDEELARILNNEGFKIARRTVTKYRENLKISVSRLRKEI